MYLQKEELCQLEKTAADKKFDTGDLVLDSGSPANHLYLVRTGLVEVFYYNKETRITVALLGPGEFFGEMGFFDGNLRVRNIQAIEDSNVLIWDHAAIQSLAANNSALYGKLITFLLVRVSERFRRVLDDLDPLAGYGAAVSRQAKLTGISEPLPHDWLSRPEFLRIKTISENFKADIFSLSYKLQEAKSPEKDLQAQCLTVLNSLYKDVLCYGQEFPHVPEGMWGYLFKEIFPYFMRSRFAERIYFKPRGYAGDHMMMEMIYTDVPSGDGKLGEIVDGWCLQSFGARATRGRRKLLCRWLQEKSTILLEEKSSINIMNMACGPARELGDFLSICSCPEKINVLCVDIDEDALSRANSNLSTIEHKAAIRFFKTNLIKWALGKVTQQIGSQDIIYSAGLADYLEDRLFIALVNRAYEHLHKGGVFIIGNFSPNPDQFFMDHILHWRLIYRTEHDLRGLFSQTGFGDNIKILSEDEGVNLFVEAVRA